MHVVCDVWCLRVRCVSVCVMFACVCGACACGVRAYVVYVVRVLLYVCSF